MKKLYIKPAVMTYELVGRESLMFNSNGENVYEETMDGPNGWTNEKDLDDNSIWDD